MISLKIPTSIRLLLAFCWIAPVLTAAHSAPELTWEMPSQSQHGSMPLGNGETGINLWARDNGQLSFYLSRTDAWSGNVRLLKLGLIRVEFTPNPFDDGHFRQTLDARNGRVHIKGSIEGEAFTARVWVDAHNSVVNVEANCEAAFDVRVESDPWRTAPREVDASKVHGEIHSFFAWRGGDRNPTVKTDRFSTSIDNAIVGFHRNLDSNWRTNLEHQQLGEWADNHSDPLMHRTFGYLIAGDGLERVSDLALETTEPVNHLLVRNVTHTQQTETAEAWIEAINDKHQQIREQDFGATVDRHVAWWQDFWQRSAIDIRLSRPLFKEKLSQPGTRVARRYLEGRAFEQMEGSDETLTLTEDVVDKAYKHEAARVRTLSDAYNWHRFVLACAGRGNFPLKFNGSLFTVKDVLRGLDYDADYRRWGGPYWFQNTRLVYWPMLMSGDWDMMKPLFDTYMKVLPLATYRTKKYFDHPGAYFFETMEFWGGSPEYIYGWDHQREESGVREGYTHHTMHRYHFNAGLELSAIMLDYFRYSEDRSFVEDYLIPLADPVITFFSEHYPRDAEGRLKIAPSQALESWQNVVNPATEVGGLHYVLDGLIALPDDLATNEQREKWRKLKSILPDIPTREIDGETAIWVADETSKTPVNFENPELYPVFPFRLYGLFDSESMEAAKRAFDNRRVSNNRGWSQDEIQAALLGETETAARMILERAAGTYEKARFPAFWRPNHDWIPDQDHGSVLLIALQYMLLQSYQDGTIGVLPAWPEEWNVDFRLHAYGDTVVSGSYEDGQWVKLNTFPEDQESRLVRMNEGGRSE